MSLEPSMVPMQVCVLLWGTVAQPIQPAVPEKPGTGG